MDAISQRGGQGHSHLRGYTTWQRESGLQELAKKAQGLFQWAFVACGYIARPPRDLNSKLCFRRVLNPPTTFKKGSKLFGCTTVLEGFNMKDSEVCDGFHSA